MSTVRRRPLGRGPQRIAAVDTTSGSEMPARPVTAAEADTITAAVPLYWPGAGADYTAYLAGLRERGVLGSPGSQAASDGP